VATTDNKVPPAKLAAMEIHKIIGKSQSKLMDFAQLELGTVTDEGIKLDRHDFIIDDYMMLDYLQLEDQYETDVTTEPATVGDHGEHTHEVKIINKTPDPIKKLKTGTRFCWPLLITVWIL